MAYETITVEVDDHVATITLNRPDALNALNSQLLRELCKALGEASANDKVRCIVLTGSKKAFSGGADIKEIQEKTYPESYYEAFISRNWERAARARKPIVAAVSGYAIGGGCELALMCDIIIAGDHRHPAGTAY